MQQPEERNQRNADKILFVDKSSNAAESEMLEVFISSFDEVSKEVYKNFVSYVEVSPTAAEKRLQILKYQDMEIKQIRLIVFVVPNSMWYQSCLTTIK